MRGGERPLAPELAPAPPFENERRDDREHGGRREHAEVVHEERVEPKPAGAAQHDVRQAESEREAREEALPPGERADRTVRHAGPGVLDHETEPRGAVSVLDHFILSFAEEFLPVANAKGVAIIGMKVMGLGVLAPFYEKALRYTLGLVMGG